MAYCYRHPDRETGVSCSSCGRPICPDCMTPTPVGMRCPECARERTQVRTAATLRQTDQPLVTYTLIGINVLAFLVSIGTGGGLASGGGGTLIGEGALFGPAIANQDEYWRLVTGGFLHAGILHIALNMYFLYILGNMLEPALGHVRFTAVYFTSLLAGSFGALLLEPNAVTVGASGAVFGLMGAAVIEMRSRGIDLWSSGLGLVLVINLVLSFVLPNISIGGHLGGLVGGVLAALVIDFGSRQKSTLIGIAGCVGLSIAAIAGSIAVAGSAGLT
jgi:membrane associated rhomboid family serine protease